LPAIVSGKNNLARRVGANHPVSVNHTALSLGYCSMHLHTSVASLALLMGRLPARFSTDLTSLWAGLADDRKWRKDIAESMLRAKLLNGPEVDTHLCKVLQISRSPTQPVEFAVHIV